MFFGKVDLSSILTVVIWIVFFPALWLYARFFPRIPTRVLLWSNEGFRVAPPRVRCYGFARELKKLGVDVSVLTFWDHLAHYTGLPPFRTTLGVRTRLTFRAMMEGVRSRAGVIVFQRPFYEFMSVISLKIMYPFTLKVWLDVDDWIFDYPVTPPPGELTFRNMLPIYRAVSTGCVVSSARLDTEMRKHFTKVAIIPTFPDGVVFNNSPAKVREDKAVVFSWVGTLFREEVARDVLFLVEVLESLKDPSVILEIVGAGEYLEYTRSRAHAIAAHTQLSFLGWREPREIPAYLKTVDVGLYCLTTHDDFCASKSPTKLFEYMACGKPTVSTNFGEAPRFIEHGVTGFLANDAGEFAECCGLLVADPRLRSEVGIRARNRIESEYNLSVAAGSLRKVLLTDS